MANEPESESELRARLALEEALGRKLTRFRPQPGRRSPDYADERDEAYEMKQVTSEELRALGGQANRTPFFPSEVLVMRWSVLLNAPTMEDKFRPMPNFPNDDPDQIAALEAEGFMVQRKVEREAKWRARFSGQKRPIPRVSELPLLEPLLQVLEDAGITNTREAPLDSDEQRQALRQIGALTHGAICIAQEALGQPGIDLVVGFGYARAGDPDVLAFRTQSWLDSKHSSNLRDSLWLTFSRRHGVLIFDSSEPEYWSAQGVGPDFVPTTELVLPPEIDTLWCLVGRLLLRYDPEHGWASSRIDDEHSQT